MRQIAQELQTDKKENNNKMSITKRNAFVAVVSCLIMLFIFCGCSFSLEREYYDDIHVQLETRQAEIIIKECSWGLGSGAEIYYKADGKKVLLGQTDPAIMDFAHSKRATINSRKTAIR